MAMKIVSRSIDLISKRKQIARAAHFFSKLQKNKFARAACFLSFFAVFWHNYNAVLNVLVTHYFYGGIVVCAYLIFCFLCSCSLLFFTAPHFHLAGRQHFSLSHRRFEFSCFSSYKIRLFCFQSLALALCLLYT